MPAQFRFHDLAGRTLLVTGVTRGIGRAILPQLLEQGLQLVLVSRGGEKLERVRAELGADAQRVRTFDCDLGDSAAVESMAKSLLASGSPLDAVLHNAAIDPRQTFENVDPAFWHHVLQVNVVAGATLVRHLLPRLRASAHGRILFTGSVMADFGGAYLTAYGASKWALVGLTRSLAHELKGSGITVNCVVPGAIQVEKVNATEEGNRRLIGWQSVPRVLTPGDLVGLLALLLSEAGGAITGQAITVDGGLLHPLAAPETQQRWLPS